MNRAAIAVTVALAIVLPSCSGGGDAGAGSPTGPATRARPRSTAELAIAAPRNGAVVRGSPVDLRVDLEGAKIVPQTTQDIAPDEGHLHVLLDDQLISMTQGTEQTIPDVAPGAHRITVEFVASDHLPFDPRVVAVVAFEVRS